MSESSNSQHSTDSTVMTVFFEDPFWVGVIERHMGKYYQVCKIVFGSEPKDNEVYLKLLKDYNFLNFSSMVTVPVLFDKKTNPKRIKKLIRKELNTPMKGTKAQQVLKQFQQQNKAIRSSNSKEQKEKEKQEKFLLSKEKRKEKHKGH